MVLYICQTLDGFIAKSDHSIDFLQQINQMVSKSNNSNIKNSYEDFIKDIDVVIQGYNTYDVVRKLGYNNPYSEFENYVITSNHKDTKDDSITKFIDFKTLKKINLGDKKVWLIGGSKLITSCMNSGMVNEMIIFNLPIFLNQGIKLFDNIDYNKYLKIEKVIHDENFYQVHYKER